MWEQEHGTFIYQSRVTAFSGTTGKIVWSFTTRGWVDRSPVVDGDGVFVGSQDRNVYCVDRDTGTMKQDNTT